MGCFDNVNYPPQPCWHCGAMVGGPREWQSEDGECLLALVEPSQVRCFYDICPECKSWNEYRVVVEAYRVEHVPMEDDND